VQRGVIRVNHPLEYRGVRFFQSFFGPAAVLQIRNDKGELLYDDALPLTGVRTTAEYQRPEGGFGLSGADVMIYIIGSARNLDDPVISNDQVGLEVYTKDSETPFSIKLQQGEPATLEGLEFTLVNQVRWTGLEVSRDPSNMLIWLASVLFLLGLVIVFYFPGSQVYLMLQRLPKGGSQLIFYSLPNRHPGVNAQIRSLSQELQNELTRGETKEKN
jgi:cytochrome c biogenesis protein